MILLDTDHISVLRYPEYARPADFQARLTANPTETFATSMVTVEEQMRGWLALMRRLHDFAKQIPIYEWLGKMIDFFSRWRILPFDNRAANECQRLRKQRIRIGTMDLKIAAIARVNDALLLSGNLCDFQKVPGLRVASWLD